MALLKGKGMVLDRFLAQIKRPSRIFPLDFLLFFMMARRLPARTIRPRPVIELRIFRDSLLRSFALILGILWTATLLPATEPPPVPNAPPGEEQELTLGDNKYWLIMPPNYNRKYSYPLVVFLDANTGTATKVFLSSDFRSRHPTFAAIPKVPPTGGRNPGSWSNYKANAAETEWVFTWDGTLTPGGKFAVDLIKALIKQYPIDPGRIYLTGLSDGAFGTSELTAFNNKLISAAITVSGAGDLRYAKNLINVPFWALHGAKDPTVNAQLDRDWVAAIKAAGGTLIRYTEIPDGQHTVWNQVYNDPATWDWLFAQGSSSAAAASSKK
jgi:predicted esterase